MRLGMFQVACKTTLQQVEGQAEALAFQLLDQLGDVIRAGYNGVAESFQAMATELGKVFVFSACAFCDDRSQCLPSTC